MLVQNGFDWKEAWNLDPLERMAIAYSFAKQNGCKINWNTGEISPPK